MLEFKFKGIYCHSNGAKCNPSSKGKQSRRTEK